MIKTGVLTLSDRGAAGQREDKSGAVIKDLVAEIDGEVVEYQVIPDDQQQIIEELKKLADQGELDLVLTTGGTGLAPSDVTPEATKEVIERRVPGIPETMRLESLPQTRKAMLSRAEAGVRGTTLIVNLPGSPQAVTECLEIILPVLPHAVELIHDQVADCGRSE